MLSSTSVSSTGNIHRRVIVFPFVVPSVVQRKESRWSPRGTRPGWRMDFSLQMNTVQGSEGLLSDRLRPALTKGCRSIVHTSVQIDAGHWSQCMDQLVMTMSPKSWSKSEIKWFFFSQSSQLFMTDAEVWRYLRCWVLNWAKTKDPLVWF